MTSLLQRQRPWLSQLPHRLGRQSRRTHDPRPSSGIASIVSIAARSAVPSSAVERHLVDYHRPATAAAVAVAHVPIGPASLRLQSPSRGHRFLPRTNFVGWLPFIASILSPLRCYYSSTAPPNPSPARGDDAPGRRRRDAADGDDDDDDGNNRIFRRSSRSQKTQLNEHGHDYAQVGEPVDSSICIKSESEIHDLLRARLHCKLERDFESADRILDELGAIGVQVNDKNKSWRAVSLNEHGHEYKQADGTIVDPSVCTLTERRMHAAIRDRMRCKHARNYREADRIEERLRRFGVELDDKKKEWRADGVRFESSAGVRLNRFGHNYTQVGGPVDERSCALRRDEIHDLIRERMRCKLARDFARADTIQSRLRGFGVDVDDRLKEWRADGQAFERVAMRSTRNRNRR